MCPLTCLGNEEETVETLMDTVRGAEAASEPDVVGGRCEEVECGGRGESGAEQGKRAEDVEHAGREVGLGTEDKGERGTGGERGGPAHGQVPFSGRNTSPLSKMVMSKL